MREWSTETENAEFHIPVIPNGNRNITVENSQEHSSPSSLALPLPTLDLPESENFLENREKARLQDHCAQVVLHWEMHLMHQWHQGHASQQERTLESQPKSRVTNFTCKDTIATWIVNCQLGMLNFELYTYLVVLQTENNRNMPYFKFFI